MKCNYCGKRIEKGEEYKQWGKKWNYYCSESCAKKELAEKLKKKGENTKRLF